MTHGLRERVPVGKAALFLVADAAVEVILVARLAPERHAALGEQVVDQFGDRAVQPLHQRAEIFADLQVAERVVMIVEQTCDPGREVECLRGVVLEAIPENCLGLLRWQRRESDRDSGPVMKYTWLSRYQCSKR